VKLWRSGIFWSVLSFVSGLGYFAFNAVIARQLSPAEYGYSSTIVTGFVSFLSLPTSIVSASLIHYIAHFRGQNDEARLQGLLAGCQRFLVKITIAGSILAVLLAEPLGRFFGYRTSLMQIALLTVLVALWSGLAVALCQGMAWFKRLALVGLVAVCMKLIFGWAVTIRFPKAEMALLATTFSLLANLSLLYWWKDIFRHGAERISPWTREFFHFLLITGTYVAGNWFFLNGTDLVAKKYFTGADLGAYTLASRWGFALPATLLPLLQVMFTSRSGGKHGQALSDQRILLVLYTIGLGCGAAVLILFRDIWIRILSGAPNPRAAAILVPYTIAMAFAGLSQAMAMWSLASRWFKLASCYGLLGLANWLTLMAVARSPEQLLRIMPVATASAFVVLLAGWLVALRAQAPVKTAV
jgi:O-antigen/teichoic acid export membrane protein